MVVKLLKTVFNLDFTKSVIACFSLFNLTKVGSVGVQVPEPIIYRLFLVIDHV